MRKIKDSGQVILILVTVVLLVINVFLVVQNFQLKKSLEQSQLFTTEVGYNFTDLKIRRLDGNEKTINLSDGQHKTLLLVFHPSCQYCSQQYPYWKSLVENLDTGQWNILAVTSETDADKIKMALDEYKMDKVTVASISRDDLQKTRMMYTPMTIVVGADGEVKKVWSGLRKNLSPADF